MKLLLCLTATLLCSFYARAETRLDVEYAKIGGESLKLDAYLPEGAGPFPAAVIVHGGGYTGGDKGKNDAPRTQRVLGLAERRRRPRIQSPYQLLLRRTWTHRRRRHQHRHQIRHQRFSRKPFRVYSQ